MCGIALTRLVAVAALAGCASSPTGGRETGAGARSDTSAASTDELGGGGTAGSGTDAGGGAGASGLGGEELPASPETGIPVGVPRSHAYPGFVPATVSTEPVAVLPAARITLPSDLASGSLGEDLKDQLNGLLLDRLPVEVRILHPRAPVHAFREWARPKDADVGPKSGYLPAILGWQGEPGRDGALPETVGNSVEALGDHRGIRYFLFPRSLAVVRNGSLRYVAVLDAYLLDARGERAVWAGSGQAEGLLPNEGPEEILRGVILNAAEAAMADLAARLPGSERPIRGNEFTEAAR